MTREQIILLVILAWTFSACVETSGDAKNLEDNPGSPPDQSSRVYAICDISGTLRVHPGNRRYFTNDSGRAIYLTGSHTWLNLQDGILDGKRLDFDYERFLDFLRERNHNFFRLWTWESPVWVIPDSRTVHLGPMVFRRTGPGTARDGRAKFDLTRFDPAYFNQMRSRVEAARNKGVYVAVMLFQGFSVSRKSKRRNLTPWADHPMNAANNVNGIEGDVNGDGEGYETHTLTTPRITHIQEAYVRKVIDTVNDMDNVIYEISNESHGDSARWQYHMIRLIHKYEQDKPKQHPVWMSFTWDGLAGPGRDADLFGSPAEVISPRGKSTGRGKGKWAYAQDPPVADGSKVVIADTDHLWGIGGNSSWVWKSFLRGLHPIFMDPYKESPHHSESKLDPRWDPVRRAMGHTNEYAKRANLIDMTPTEDSGLCSTRYCLRNPGAEYLIYQPDSGPFSVQLKAGNYHFEWFDPTKGKVADSGRLDWPGGKRDFAPPFDGAAVLYLVSAEAWSNK